MYGMVNQAVRGLVLERFGAETWGEIHRRAEAPESFIQFEQYDDDLTYRMVGAASEVIGLEPAAVLRVFGQYWVASVAAVHYAELMDKTGVSFLDFLRGLDHMHSRIRTTFPNYNPPSFRVKELQEGELLVDYYSQREGLLPFVEGLLEGVAEHFETSIHLAHVPDDDHPMPCKRMRLSFGPAD